MNNSMCKITKAAVTTCEGMSRTLQAGHGGGVTEELLFNARFTKAIGRIFILRSGEFKKNGIVLNFCPFCGQRIYQKPKKEGK